MFTLIKSLFTKPSSIKSEPDYFDQYLIEGVMSSKFIKDNSRNFVLEALRSKNYLTDGDVLSAKEKKDLKINPRLKITKEQESVLTLEALNKGSKRVLQALVTEASHRNSRRKSFEKLISLNMKPMLLACNDNRDCEWCLSQDKKVLDSSLDIDEYIQLNCTCELYCRCGIISARSSNK